MGSNFDHGTVLTHLLVSMAEPPQPFATRRHGESYGVGTWREGGEWRECSNAISVKINFLE